ncbi:NAD(P)/FAD-dependent oxidoreductase [Cytobacillus oceanisediminis]|uniref:NAD(P)/FAD-dependent oxidoreductase n=1 Tax=Cytobacillus oceanisediminis TaxID=665099 RepID=UPI001C21D981|nr:NAD(P)/FAD-dependent oxidoreductase [Cytobacillus oceanisediminis]MBU8772121.1 NAD(P)/FAD-dependent oxidoreductase [Cytobacillus oceanisediminis]
MYDFIIVGARCAGASLAIFLGRLGYSILLIDKYSSPGPTTSTHIIGEVDIYERLGINLKMESVGAPSLTRVKVDLESNVFESDMFVTTRALGMRREYLDRFLLEEVKKISTIDVLLESRVIGLVKKDNKVIGIRCKGTNGAINNKYAKVTVGADGRNSTVAKNVNALATKKTSDKHLSVYYSYIENIQPLPIPTLEWYWNKNNVVICNPIDKDLHCIAIMASSEEKDSLKLSKPENFINYLLQIKTLAPRIKKPIIHGRIKGIDHLTSHINHPFGDGWVLAGDASAHLHPISGVGIDNAICTAEELSIQLHDYMQGHKDWTEAMRVYTQYRDERIDPQYEASLRTLSLAAKQVSIENIEYLKMFCTFPSYLKKVAMESQQIINFINGGK